MAGGREEPLPYQPVSGVEAVRDYLRKKKGNGEGRLIWNFIWVLTSARRISRSVPRIQTAGW